MKIARIVMGLILAIAGVSFILAGGASAHAARASSVPSCDGKSGQWKDKITVQNDTGYGSATISGTGIPALDGSVLHDGASKQVTVNGLTGVSFTVSGKLTWSRDNYSATFSTQAFRPADCSPSTTPGPTVTITESVPGPTTTVTAPGPTSTVTVAGPTVTETAPGSIVTSTETVTNTVTSSQNVTVTQKVPGPTVTLPAQTVTTTEVVNGKTITKTVTNCPPGSTSPKPPTSLAQTGGDVTLGTALGSLLLLGGLGLLFLSRKKKLGPQHN